MKKWLWLFTFIIAFIFLFFPKGAFAQIVINEFSSNSDPEWVELYNNSEQIVGLTGWKIVDGNQSESDDIDLSGCINAWASRLFSRAKGWLNDTGGDTITLKNSSNIQIDQVIYGTGGIIGIPLDKKSAGRDLEDKSVWKIFDSPTPKDDSCSLPTPTPTPTPTPAQASTPTPTPTSTPKPPTPTQRPMATYKINEVKDEDGEILNNVKVYVDDIYLHHYAPEVLTFGDDCQCDTYVDCGFGQHLIKLEKTGYHNWNETKTFNVGDFYEVSPVMIFLESTSTPTPTSSPTPTPRQIIIPSLTPKATVKIATNSGEVLGEEEATLSAFYPYNEASNSAKAIKESTSSAQKKVLPKVFLFVGLGIILVSLCWSWLKIWYNYFY